MMGSGLVLILVGVAKKIKDIGFLPLGIEMLFLYTVLRINKLI